MLILTMRTDKPEAEIGLFNGNKKLAYETWTAHRQLAEGIHKKIHELLKSQGKDWHDIQGIVCFKGPGSFTGLRIGLTVANALASSLDMPISGEVGEDWLDKGITNLQDGKNDEAAMPEYGSEPHITLPKT